jgi:hypothetical protein
MLPVTTSQAACSREEVTIARSTIALAELYLTLKDLKDGTSTVLAHLVNVTRLLRPA